MGADEANLVEQCSQPVHTTPPFLLNDLEGEWGAAESPAERWRDKSPGFVLSADEGTEGRRAERTRQQEAARGGIILLDDLAHALKRRLAMKESP